VHTIAVLNQKGGVGKTTTVANLGAAVAARGCRVCLIDLDPQSHLTLHFGIEPGQSDVSIYDVLSGDTDLLSACVRVTDTVTVVPSVIDLAAAEVELAATVGREQILRDALGAQAMDCDLVLMDCPPSLGLLTLNALAAADEIFIPLQPHFLALQGLGKLLETVSLVQRRINPALRVGGVILCMYETATRLAAEVVADLEGFFDATHGTDCPWGEARIYQTVIRRNIKLAECPSHGKTIFDYDPASRGAADYGTLADEFVASYPALFPEAVVRAAVRPARVVLPYNSAMPPRVVPAPVRPARRATPLPYNPAQAQRLVPPAARPARRATPLPYNPAQAQRLVPPAARPARRATPLPYNPAQTQRVVPPQARPARPATPLAYNPAQAQRVVPASPSSARRSSAACYNPAQAPRVPVSAPGPEASGLVGADAVGPSAR